MDRGKCEQGDAPCFAGGGSAQLLAAHVWFSVQSLSVDQSSRVKQLLRRVERWMDERDALSLLRNCTLSLAACNLQSMGRLALSPRTCASFFDLSDNPCSNGGSDISQHEAAQFLVVLVQLQRHRPLGLDLHDGIHTFTQALWFLLENLSAALV